MYRLFTIKRYIEQFLMYPFILIGKVIAMSRPLKEEYDVFFFYPGYSTGGAERVNAEIVKAVSDKKVIIFFTKISYNDGMKHFFTLDHVTIVEIGKWVVNKWHYWTNFIQRGRCSYYINSQKKKPVVFIGHCNFGYKLTPHIRRDIKIHELMHMHHAKFTWVWAPFVRFIDTRIIVGEVFKKKFLDCYIKEGIPLKYFERVKKIFYRLEFLPESNHPRNYDLPLKVYYAGRGGPQKRVWIIMEIIKKARSLKLPIVFTLAGPFEEEVPQELITDGTYIGNIKGGENMYQLHKKNDVLLMTSWIEGFPLVIMEAMSFGVIPLVPDIDAIPEHVMTNITGFLLENVLDESKMINDAIEYLMYMVNNPEKLNVLSENAFKHAMKNFSEEVFNREYRKLLCQP